MRRRETEVKKRYLRWMMIYLEEINPNNWRLGLRVAKEQENYVSNDFRMLARAYAYREYRSKAFVIYKDATPIGMAMYYDGDEIIMQMDF